jgi:hypothetical protein
MVYFLSWKNGELSHREIFQRAEWEISEKEVPSMG